MRLITYPIIKRSSKLGSSLLTCRTAAALIFVFSVGKFISEFLGWDPVEPQAAAIT